ncbi:hypothetical protein JOC95_001504 [Bacillus tianshenii]|uniref:Uncharacterized protein n=1 Tax=Sutcliffiella tianshenii TaxID=1463404 RepID=A0ABS2NZ24_9BACI|nr:hypothetical protein [Bacillus tianshenii]MBM7619652.1 hypothetical protein [Bacillus tianshenii]
MNSLYKKTITFLLCFLVLLIPQANAALYEDIPFETMVEQADLIIVGKINGAFEERTQKVEETEVEEDIYLGFTDWKIDVTSYLKGESEGDSVLVTTPGIKGESADSEAEFRYRSSDYLLDEMIQSMEEELNTEVEDILFFLEERDGYFHPITPKAIIPLNIIYWEENLNPDVVNMDEISPEVLGEMEYLQDYLKKNPNYSSTSKGQTWYPYAASILPLGLLVWYFKRKRGKQQI